MINFLLIGLINYTALFFKVIKQIKCPKNFDKSVRYKLYLLTKQMKAVNEKRFLLEQQITSSKKYLSGSLQIYKMSLQFYFSSEIKLKS